MIPIDTIWLFSILTNDLPVTLWLPPPSIHIAALKVLATPINKLCKMTVSLPS